MKTLIAADCDPNCKAKQAVVGLGEAHDLDMTKARWDGATLDGYREAMGEVARIHDEYRGTGTLLAIGETCANACTLERFADGYDEFVNSASVQLGHEAEVVIKQIKDR